MWDKYQKDTARIAAKKPAVLPATKSGLLHNPEEWKRYKDTTSGRKPARPVVQPVRLALAAKSAAAFRKAPLTTKPTQTRRAATTHVAAHPAPLTARKPRAVAVPA